MRRGDLCKRELAVDHDFQLAGVDQRADVGQPHAVGDDRDHGGLDAMLARPFLVGGGMATPAIVPPLRNTGQERSRGSPPTVTSTRSTCLTAAAKSPAR